MAAPAFVVATCAALVFDMRKTESISDPNWNDIQDRDKQIKIGTAKEETAAMLLHQAKAEIFELNKRLWKADTILHKFGFQYCNIPACNCNGYHLMTPPDKSYRESINARETYGKPVPDSDGPWRYGIQRKGYPRK